MTARLAWSALGIALGLLSGARASAQVELAGTYVRYVAVGPNGTMLCSTCGTGRSMQYAETTTSTPTCDAFYPGSAVEGFTVHATPAGGTRLERTNNGTFGGDFTTVSGPTVSGRTITWRGRNVSGTTTIELDQTLELQMDDRHARLTVQLTNMGTVALNEVYYLRNSDPDHGSCSIGFDFATLNDVRRQPPTAESALVTARGGDGTAPDRTVTLGIGSHDARARVHAGGFSNTDATGEWTAPMDPAGASGDIGVDIVFREPMLAAGASTTFEILYVWGTTETEVETRFDELGFPTAPCVGLMEGATCTTGTGATGLCRSTRCCTGCWDGSRCRAGSGSSACGAGGAACADCGDADACTSDVCTAGMCSNPDAPSGTACDDGLFCTATDTCDGSGTCVGAGARCDDSESCTTDACNDTTDTCTNTGRPDLTACIAGAVSGMCRSARCCTGCWTGTSCQTGTSFLACGAGGGACATCVDGDQCTLDLCGGGACSNPFSPSGSPCDDGMYCTVSDVCSGSGTCNAGPMRSCDDAMSCTADSCDEATNSCVYTPVTGCTIGGACVGEGTVNPTYPCLVCDPARDTTDWSTRPAGTPCGMVRCTAGRLTMPSCDAAGTCAPGTPMPCPTGACASAAECEMACTPGSCPAGEHCDATTGRCEPLGDLGEPCADASACASGFCTDGVCCDELCGATCERCGAAGTCFFVPRGADPDDECAASACDGFGTCEVSPDAGPDPDAGAGDASTPGDASVAPDASAPRPRDRDGGCGCTVPTAPAPPPLTLAALALLALLRRRRPST
jgi:uncharacterized protein (TIGR03382 family)